MPIHFYAPARPPCKLCGDGFEHHAATTDAALASCPTCGQPVERRSVQSMNIPNLSAPASVSIAKQAGFAVLKRNSDGQFEKQ